MEFANINQSEFVGAQATKCHSFSTGDMHMRKYYVAYAFRIPVIEQEFLAFEVKHFIEVAHRSDLVRAALIIVRSMDDGVLVGNIEQEVGLSAVTRAEC